jgi:DNA polymerase-1
MPAKTASKPLLLIIDGHSMVFRAWFAIPERLSTSSGQDTRGAYGWLTTFLRTLRERKPTHVVLTFDTSAPTFRDAMFDQYKAQRPPTDPELHEQIPMVEDICAAFGIPVFKKDGFEADDLVGTISKEAEEQGAECLILTGDADQLQLVSDHTKLLMYSGFGDVRVYDEDAVKERYDGLGPEFIAEIKALEGDPSDNIPGVPKVGPKAARTVLKKFGHLEDVYAHLDDIPQIPKDELRGAQAVRERLEENRKVAFDGLKLTTIVRDVPIDFSLEAAKFGDFKREDVVEALSKLEFRSILRQIPDPESANVWAPPPQGTQLGLGADLDAEQAAATSAAQADGKGAVDSSGNREKLDYQTIVDPDALKSVVKALSTKDGFAFDTETTGTDPMRAALVGLSFSNAAGKAWYVPVGHNEGGQVPFEQALATLRPLFEDPEIPKTAHNANFDMMVLAEAGITVRNVNFDSMIAAALCGKRALGLKQLAVDCFHIEMTPITDLIGTGRKQITMAEVPVEKAAPYACADADIAWRLKGYFAPQLEQHGAVNVNDDIEIPLLPTIVKMQRNGITVDTSMLTEMSEELGSEMANIQQAANSVLGGRELNLNANQQIADILIDELGAPKTRKTKTGWSMDANALEGIMETQGLDDRVYQLADAVLKYRELTKLKSTYVDALPLLANPRTGRVHTSFNQVGSATGRLSSADPNVQNIPVRTPLGRRVRSAFTTDAKGGWMLLAADYSQIELRILAHLSKEPGLLEAFMQGEDIHSATARAMYGEEDVTPDQRRIAKILNFGVIYGLGPQGVARQTDLTRQQGQEFIELYFGKYPGLRDYIDGVKEAARERGYAETITGRRRYLPEITSRNGLHRSAAERVAVNMPIQGTAADIIKIAMINIDDVMTKEKMKSRMLIQVHDELIFEAAPGELMELQAMVVELMPGAMKLDVPLNVETKTGVRWGDME